MADEMFSFAPVLSEFSISYIIVLWWHGDPDLINSCESLFGRHLFWGYLRTGHLGCSSTVEQVGHELARLALPLIKQLRQLLRPLSGIRPHSSIDKSYVI
jgi:hypothetical protein